MSVGEGRIALSLEQGVSLTVELDSDTSVHPTPWIWLMFGGDGEPWYKLTPPEAAALEHRLRSLLGPHDTIHMCPRAGQAAAPCCARPVLELGAGDRITTDPAAVTCSGGREEQS